MIPTEAIISILSNLEVIQAEDKSTSETSSNDPDLRSVSTNSLRDFQVSTEYKRGLILRDSLNKVLESISNANIDPRIQHEFELQVRLMGGIQNCLSYYDWENAIYVHILKYSDITEAQARAATELLFKIIGHHFR